MNDMSSLTTKASAKPVLPPALDASRREVYGRSGRLSFYAEGAGAPLLLVHSINAAGSAYEVKPIFERLAGSRQVYAVDLPGFGFSDRSKRQYSPGLYTDAIHDMLGVIAKDGNGDNPINALAVSLGSEFLARAAVERPERFRTLTLVTPTGFSKGSEHMRGRAGETREVPGLYRFFTFPLWSQAIYDLLVSKPSIRYFLRKTFVSGKLISKDIRAIYERLGLPVWMPHGTKGDFGDFSEAGWTRLRPNWIVTPYDTGALPHFEKPEEFMRDYARFLAEADALVAGA